MKVARAHNRDFRAQKNLTIKVGVVRKVSGPKTGYYQAGACIGKRAPVPGADADYTSFKRVKACGWGQGRTPQSAIAKALKSLAGKAATRNKNGRRRRRS